MNIFDPIKVKDKVTGKLCSAVSVKEDTGNVEYFTNPFHISELTSLLVESVSGIWSVDDFNKRFIKVK
jgi:hypothetical protein